MRCQSASVLAYGFNIANRNLHLARLMGKLDGQSDQSCMSCQYLGSKLLGGFLIHLPAPDRAHCPQPEAQPRREAPAPWRHCLRYVMFSLELIKGRHGWGYLCPWLAVPLPVGCSDWDIGTLVCGRTGRTSCLYPKLWFRPGMENGEVRGVTGYIVALKRRGLSGIQQSHKPIKGYGSELIRGRR